MVEKEEERSATGTATVEGGPPIAQSLGSGGRSASETLGADEAVPRAVQLAQTRASPPARLAQLYPTARPSSSAHISRILLPRRLLSYALRPHHPPLAFPPAQALRPHPAWCQNSPL